MTPPLHRVLVQLPAVYRIETGGHSVVEVEAATAGDAILRAAGTHPGLRPHLLAEDETPRTNYNLYLNDENIDYLDGLDTPLHDGDLLAVVPAVAGGQQILSEEEQLRYRRHTVLPHVGLEGQRKLKQASVLCIGAGGLGSPLLLYLAAAGVGRLGIVDDDRVDLTNLQRQVLHRTEDVGRSKVDSARDHIASLNPHVQVDTYPVRLSASNALEILASYDIVVDGTDNFPTRYLVNDACALLGKPAVYGSIYQFEGQASVFDASRGPCYRCLFPEPPPPGSVPNCAEGGVLGVLPGLIGSLQAAETLKLLLGAGTPLVGRLLLLDALTMRIRELRIPRDPGCPLCGDHPTLTELIDYDQFCGTPPPAPNVSPESLASELGQDGAPLLLDVRQPREADLCRLENSILIPLDQLAHRIHELEPDRDIVVYCHAGVRSAHAAGLLRNAGFSRVRNLTGGIDAWAVHIDPTMPRY